MAGFVREFLQITQEGVFGAFPGAGIVRGTNQIVPRLPGANNFTMRGEPVAVDIPYGGGFAVTASTVSDKIEVKGSLTTPLCYTQASFLLGWGLTKINTGQTSPWTTTEPPNDLASATIDHAIWEDDSATYKRTRYTGCKVTGGKFEVSGQSQYGMLTLNFLGSAYQGNPFDSSTDPGATPFPVPADADYATDYVNFVDSAGLLTLGSGAFAKYESLGFSWENKVDSRYYANRFAQLIRCYGRDLTLDADVTLVASPDLRATYQAQSALIASVAFTDTTHTITLDFKAKGRIKSLADDLPLEKLYGRKFSLKSRYDTGAGTDFGFTFA